MHSKGGTMVLWGIIIGMLAFTAIRTIHFLQLTLPADQQYVAYIGLIAFDVGVLAWFYYAISAAEGATQRAIAYGMIFVCAAGVCTTTIMDMTLVASQNGLYKVPPQWFTVGLWAVILVIIANFLAGICAHLNHPEQKKRMEIQHVQDEIHTLTLKKIREQKNIIAPQIANALAQDWANQTRIEMTNHLGLQPGQVPQLLSGQVVDSTLTQQSPAQQPTQQKGLFGRIGDAITGKQETQPQQLPALPQPAQLPIVPQAEQVDLSALQRHLMQLQHMLSGLSQTPVPSNGTKEPQTSPLAEMALGQTEEIRLPKSQDQNQQNGKK